MKHKTMLLALAAISAVMFALPAVAAAANEPEISTKNLSEAFTAEGGGSEWRGSGEPVIVCTSSVASGSITSKTTGTITLLFHGCHDTAFGLECHSTGQPSGTIHWASAVFHTVYTTDNKTMPGILITPPTGGLFTTITCSLGFAPIEVRGNGIIGELTAPACGASSTTATLNFTATSSSQTYTSPTATTANGVFSLTETTEGGSPVPAALVAEVTVAFPNAFTLTCN